MEENVLKDTTTFYFALAKFQQTCPIIPLNASVKVKSSKGDYSFEYATIGQIKEIIQPILAENGLSYYQSINGEKKEIVTVVSHISGHSLISTLPFHTTKTIYPEVDGKKTGEILEVELSDQELGSRITYRKRYGLVLALGLVAEDDDDANISEGNQIQKTEKPKNNVLEVPSKDGRTLIRGTASTGSVWYAIKDADGTKTFLNDIKGGKTAKEQFLELCKEPKLDDLPF